MPRDNDKNNDSRGRRDRPFGGKGRSGAARGPEKKFAKRGFAGKSFAGKGDGDKRSYAGKPDGARSYGKRMPRVALMETHRAPHASKGTTVPGRIGLLPIVRRAATAAKSVRHLALRTGNSATSGHTLRVAKAFARRVTGRSTGEGIGATQNRGRSAKPARGPSTSRNSTSRAMTNHARTAAMIVRGFLARARIVPKVTVRFASGRSSIVLVRIVRAATTKTTARSLQNARRSAAAAPIASACLTSGVRRGRRAKRNPASASPRWCHGQASPRAAMPRNGSCRAGSPSTAA